MLSNLFNFFAYCVIVYDIQESANLIDKKDA